MEHIEFLGLNATQEVTSLSGEVSIAKRVYLDAAATCLMPMPVWDTVQAYLEAACSNSHTHGSAGGRATTQIIAKVRQLAGELVGYDPNKDVVVLNGNGATGPLNLLASILFPPTMIPAIPTKSARDGDRKPLRPLVVISSMEHHSNMLPWIRAAGGIENVRFIRTLDEGPLDINHLRAIMDMEGPRVRAVVVTGLSNVTGVITPIHDIARIAHRYGAVIVVDAAQAAAHMPIAMHDVGNPENDIDFLAMSGHKLYAPGSPGVLVGRRDVIDSAWWTIGNVGGGAVERVELESVRLKSDTSERLEAGTPNIPGTVALGAAIQMLRRVGLDEVRKHEFKLVTKALETLESISDVVVYSSASPNDRAGIMSFNISTMPHGLVAAALNDYCAVWVRNDCFCAQPYTRSQLDAACNVRGLCMTAKTNKRGMVRASFGLFTTEQDIELLGKAVMWISQNPLQIESQYEETSDGEWISKRFRPEPVFSL